MRISVVVPTFNRRAVLRDTVEGLFRQDFPANEYEIVVVVDGSTDGTAEWLRMLRPGCAFHIVEQTNAGLAAARNAGLRRAIGGIVLFLDDDIRATPGLLRAHVAAHECAREPILAIGAVFLSDDSPRSLASDCFEAEIGSFYLSHKKDPMLSFPERAWVFKNTSARRELLVRSGGFDAGLFTSQLRMQREDRELGFRLGLPVRYLPEAIGYEFYNKTPRQLLRDAADFARADALLIRRHPELWEGSLAERLDRHKGMRKFLGRAAVSLAFLTELTLAAVWGTAEHLRRIPSVRRIGLRALQWHRGLVWQCVYSRAARSDTARGSSSEGPFFNRDAG